MICFFLLSHAAEAFSCDLWHCQPIHTHTHTRILVINSTKDVYRTWALCQRCFKRRTVASCTLSIKAEAVSADRKAELLPDVQAAATAAAECNHERPYEVGRLRGDCQNLRTETRSCWKVTQGNILTNSDSMSRYFVCYFWNSSSDSSQLQLLIKKWGWKTETMSHSALMGSRFNVRLQISVQDNVKYTSITWRFEKHFS